MGPSEHAPPSWARPVILGLHEHLETGNSIDVTGVNWEWQVVIYKSGVNVPLLSTMRIEKFYEYYGARK